MNSRKINFQERIQRKRGMSGDCDIELPEYFAMQQPWHLRTLMQSSPPIDGVSQQQSLWPGRSSSTIMERFESPASAFYATERYMGLPQYESQPGNPSCSSQFPWARESAEFPSYQSPGESFSVLSAEQPDPNSEIRNTLQSVVKSDLCGNHYYKSSEGSYGNPCSNRVGGKLFPREQTKLLRDDAATAGRHLLASFDEFQDHRLNYTSRQERHLPRFSLGGVSISCGGSVSSGPVLSNKTRIRWTQDLHEKFVGCVNRLGGAEKATPKAILRLMDSDGLTIFHVKSHLQKYRMAKYIPDSAEGKSEKRSILNDVAQLDVKTTLQIKEALQLQLDVQRRLHEQLEIQRNLQMRIEEQGKQLKMLFDQQQRTNNSNLTMTQNLDITPEDDPQLSLEDVEVSMAENSGNSHFPPKIS